jgi:hypothetical protein
MPAWLVLSWALTLSYCPTYELDTGRPATGEHIPYQFPGSLVQTLHLQAEAGSFALLWTDIETRDEFSGTGFMPFLSTYTIGMEINRAPITLGVSHKCIHSVICNTIDPPAVALGGNETQIYLRIEGK